MSTETIDLQSAAELLGVHYQTAYKWVRAGTLPATMVMGAYRLESDAVARFAERRARPRRPTPPSPRADFSALSRRMFAYLANGEDRKARILVSELVDKGLTITAIAQEVLVPALREIGDEWQVGVLEVSIEHRASAIVERILGERYPKRRGRRRGSAVVAALAGDRHVLPTTLAAVALREDNWVVHHLGSDLPAAELTRFCAQVPVDLVVFTVTIPAVREASTRTATQLEAVGLRTLVGGPGRRADELQRLARGAAAG